MTALSGAFAEMVGARSGAHAMVAAVRAGVAAVGGHGGTVAVRDAVGPLRLFSTDDYDPALISAFVGLPLDAALPIAHTARTGERLLFRDRAQAVERFPGTRDVQQLTDRGGSAIVAAAVLPLVAAGRLLGSLTVTWSSEHDFTQADVLLLEALADLTARALDHADEVAHQRHRSLTLQHALLTAPPEPARVHVAVRYLPASGAAVGGDWYDAFRTAQGDTVIVIGDVVGHDARAAAGMGQLRGLVRAIAYTTEEAPAAVLTRVEEAATGLGVAALATAVVARLCPEPGPDGGHALQWTNAGHLPPLLLRADGNVLVLGTGPELMLGVDPAAARTDHEQRVEDGDTLLLFTDGLVERRGRDLEEGLGLLARHVRDLGPLPVEDLCDALLALLPPDHVERDDTALLAVRCHRA